MAQPLLQLGSDNLSTRGFVSSIAFSPDSQLIAACAANAPTPTVWLFEIQSGAMAKRIAPTDKPAGWIQSLAFSPDQSKLAWGEIGGYVALWELALDRLAWREKVHQNRVNDVKFSPDGKLLASCADDGVASLRQVGDLKRGARNFDTGKGPKIGGYSGDGMGSSGGISLAFTPDSARLVDGSAAAAEISIWRIQDGKLLRRISKAHGKSGGSANPNLQSVAVTPDGRRIISSGQHTVPITDTKLKYGPKNVNMTEIRIWDIESGNRVKDLNGDEDHGFGYASLSHDGKHIAVGDFSVLRILDAETGRPENTIPLPGSWGKRPEFSPDGNLVAMPIGNSIGLFEVTTGRQLHQSEQTPVGDLVSAAWSPSGDQLVTGHGDGGVRVWDAATGTLLWYKLLAPVISPSGRNARPAFVAFSADGHRIVVAGRRDDPVNWQEGIVAIYEARKGLLVRSIELRRIRNAALSPDRKVIVAATSHGSINDTHLVGINFETGKILYTSPPEDVRAGYWQLNTMQFRPASLDLLLGDGNGDVIQLDGLIGKEQRRFVADYRTVEERQAARPQQLQLWQAAFSGDGRVLVSSSADVVAVWDVESGKMRRKIRHPHEHGCHVAVSPDGKTLATSELQYAGDYGEDTIRLHDLETGEQVMTMEPQDNRAGVLVFSPDGTKLFSGFERGSATIWDLRR
jgi:WD40 repeat protein